VQVDIKWAARYVPDVVISATWGELDANSARSPDTDENLEDIETEAAAVLDRAAPLVRAVVRARV
jgi:hypothetical protein